jgi:tetratricopeptide (TPR) repeat protein
MNESINDEVASGPPQAPALVHAWIFVLQYINTREHRRLLWGLPCLVFAVAFAAVSFASVRSLARVKLSQVYLQEARTSLKGEQYESAELYLRRSLVEQPDDASTLYLLALVIGQRGDVPRAAQLMRRIAPLEPPGYGPAYLWLAERCLGQGALSPQEVKLVESDLLRAATDAKLKSTAQGLLADFYLKNKRPQEAEPLLESLAEQGGERRLAAAFAYRQIGRMADARKEAAKAIQELRREVDSRPDSGGLRLKLADACSLASRWEEGEAVLRAGILLDPDGQCVPALARLYAAWAAALARQSGTASQAQQKALYVKAVAVLEDSAAPSHETRLLLAEAALAAEDEKKAERVLRELAPSNVPARLRLAKLLLKRRDVEAARAEASVALHDSLEALRDSPDDLPLRQQAADAAELLRDYNQAIELLRESAASGRIPLVSENVARLRVAQWDQEHGELPKRQAAGDVALLMQAFDDSPWNQGVVRRLWTVSREESPAGRAASAFLHDKLNAGNVPVVGHAVLGSVAAQVGDYAPAREHLELAWRQAPNQFVVVNNLAWTLAHCDVPDLPRALMLIEDLPKSERNNVDVVHTRGYIYFKLERWRDAAADLERVLPFRPRDSDLHRVLALAFGKLKLAEMSERHAKQADKLEAEAGR